MLAKFRLSTIQALFVSFFIGILLDILNSSTPFGYYAITMTLSMLFLAIFNIEYFFSSKIATFLMSVLLFVFIQTGLEQALGVLFKLYVHTSLEWMFSDLIVYPVLDVLYSWFMVYLLMKRYYIVR
ncbi:MAG: hypothetical protein P4L16_02045 [Chlamydiales bacterium]|nr:hypothetical protein [Chlamydiales bacterium]